MSETRREFLKKAGYITPAILTMAVAPSVYGYGSGSQTNNRKGNEGIGNLQDPPPPGHETNCNDYDGTSPSTGPGKCGT